MENKNKFKQYKRKGLSEMRPYVPAEDLTGISVSENDKQLATDFPNIFMQGYIARNPDNHTEQWYVAKSILTIILSRPPLTSHQRRK